MIAQALLFNEVLDALMAAHKAHPGFKDCYTCALITRANAARSTETPEQAQIRIDIDNCDEED